MDIYTIDAAWYVHMTRTLTLTYCSSPPSFTTLTGFSLTKS